MTVADQDCEPSLGESSHPVTLLVVYLCFVPARVIPTLRSTPRLTMLLKPSSIVRSAASTGPGGIQHDW